MCCPAPLGCCEDKVPQGCVMCWCCINCLSLDAHLACENWCWQMLCKFGGAPLVAGWYFCINPCASVTSVSWDSLLLILFTQHMYPFLLVALSKNLLTFPICHLFLSICFLCPPHTCFVPGDWITPYCKIGLISVNRCLLNIGSVLLNC